MTAAGIALYAGAADTPSADRGSGVSADARPAAAAPEHRASSELANGGSQGGQEQRTASGTGLNHCLNQEM